MKKLVLIAAVASLAACNTKTEEAPVAENSAASAAELAGKSTTPPGLYTVTNDNGPAGTTLINADGTYVDTAPDGSQVKGAITGKNGMDCFDPEGDEGETCFTLTPPAADGSFKATSTDGKMTVTVTPAMP